MALLCRVTNLRLTYNLAPAIRAPIMVHTRYASGLTHHQKRTLDKYAAKSAKSKKKDGGFLSSAKQGGDLLEKKKKEAEDEDDDTPKLRKSQQSQEADAGKSKKPSEEGLSQLKNSELNDELNLPNFTVTEQRYEEYEAGLFSEAKLEKVSEKQLVNERANVIKRLWEPYETETFNLKSFIGDSVGIEPSLEDAEKPSKMFYYTEEEINKYLPEGIAGRVNKVYEWPGFSRKAILVRPFVEEVICWLESWKNKQFIGRRLDKDYYRILEGKMGAGKSCGLNPIVHWARLTGWLVLYVPDGRDWAGLPKAKMGVTKSLSFSKVNDTWFGQPYIAMHWIKALLTAHGDKLEKLHLKTNFMVRDVDPDKSYFKSSPDKTLKDLLEYGLKVKEQASDCVWYLRQEMCCVTEYPVLIVADAVNCLRGPSFYGDPLDPYVFAENLPASRLVLNRAFQDFRNHGLINGMYVGTICNSANTKSVKVKRPNPDMRRTQYELDPRMATIKVPTLSRAEAHTLARWYTENGIIDDVPAQTVDYMWAMAEGNGDFFWKQAEYV